MWFTACLKVRSILKRRPYRRMMSAASDTNLCSTSNAVDHSFGRQCPMVAARSMSSVVVMAIAVSTVMLLVTVVIVMSMIPMIVARRIFGGSDEIHRPVTGVVLTAVLTPVLGMPRRNMQINRGRRGRVRYRLDQHRLGVHERWPRVAKLFTSKGVQPQFYLQSSAAAAKRIAIRPRSQSAWS
jgi:hypothetical protein